MRAIIALLVVGLAGCETMPRGETTWQLLHTVDTLQTINGPASDACYKEGNPVTAKIIGEKPSSGEVLAWGVAAGAAHYGISKYLERRAPEWMLTTWQSITITTAVGTVATNNARGIKPWGDNDHSGLDRGHWCARG